MIESLDQIFLDEIIKKLKENKIGIFPCDTIYGIIGVFNEEVLEKIYALKKRPKDNPFLLLIPNRSFLNQLTQEINKTHLELINAAWPGPVTFIFKKNKKIPDLLTANKPTIGIRLPKFAPLNYLLDKLNQPLISTSVNFAGVPAINNILDLPHKMFEELEFACFKISPCLMQESAIIDILGREKKIIRPGSGYF
ncbi:MAG: L-threonylcarbamoyladenylate synthase [Candidatus Margulisiibacteriota bacterium]|jgi:L-threonylcarbamoyladenylate synthase